jgi:1-acyl-sn-glycerol-3-phosphate acyltransferase
MSGDRANQQHPDREPAPARKRRRSPLSLFWQVPFSIYVWICAFGVMIATSLVSVVLYKVRTPANQSLWSARAFARVLNVARSRVRVTHDPNFDPARNSVFCQNHVNLLDAFSACNAIPQAFVGMMLAWHFKVPGYGWMMRATHGIPVQPFRKGQTDELIREVRDRVEKGLSILTFPEAHRTLDGKMRPFKRGVFYMARDSGLPVVALAVRGMYEVNRKGSALIVPGDVDIYVGPQLETRGLGDEQLGELARELKAAMAEFVEGRDPDGAAMRAMGEKRGDVEPQQTAATG